MPVTLKDIAEELNVSVNTVSRALRDMPDIGQETTLLVKDTAMRFGYRKNLVASSLKTAKSMMLGIIVPNICNPVYSYIYKGIEKVCNESGYTLMLGNSNSESEQESRVLENMLDHGVDGIFLVPSMKNLQVWERLHDASIPYVLLQRRFPGIDANIVQSSDYEGGYIAAKHLYESGHRSFVYISAPMYISSARERYGGFLAYLKEQGLTEESVRVFESDSTRDGGYEAAKKWLGEQVGIGQKWPQQEGQVGTCESPTTAIFCFSDYMAYGVYAAIGEAELKVPQDISVIGYDNNEYSEIIYPPLTTVDMLPFEIGLRSAEKMFALIDREEAGESPETILSPKLILRESTRELS